MAMNLSPLDTTGTKDEAISNARKLLDKKEFQAAVIQAREILAGDPNCPAAHRLLGMALRKLGKAPEAKIAEAKAIEFALLDDEVFEGAIALAENRLDAAERALRPYLRKQPDDAAAMRMLAEIAARTGHFDAAEELLQRALLIAPEFEAAQSLLEATRQLRQLQSQRLHGNGVRATVPIGDSELQNAIAPSQTYGEALKLYQKAVEVFSDVPHNWVSYGHVLRTVGRQAEAIAAYRRAIEIDPSFGEAWWALADLKTAEFSPADIATMQRFVASEEVSDSKRMGIHFALGKALEQQGDVDNSFAHYCAGNRFRSAETKHDRQAVTRHVDASIQLFDRDFFAARTDAGFDARDPIFVLGLPRSGSTLLEQILSSHALVEGTMELGDMPQIAAWLADGRRAGLEDSNFLETLSNLTHGELRKLGQGYIWGTGLRRTTSRPYFIDKMPNNWLYMGLILTIVPNAKIIDARRHPLACGFSNFKQRFAKGQAFSYDLSDFGSFYANYVRMMQHFDSLLPGRVHRVIYERLVEDPEYETRAILDYLGLEFDEACLRFHENPRAVRTSSSEQVRRPINREGLDQWRPFERFLGELKDALGPVLECYPDVPEALLTRQ